LEELWRALADPDPAVATPARWRLAVPGCVAFIRGKLAEGGARPADGEVARLLAGLDAPDFASREAASNRLAELGEGVVPDLERHLRTATSPEVVARVEVLLKRRFAWTPDRGLSLRDVRALEEAGTSEAREVLKAGQPGLASPLVAPAAAAAAEPVR
jgi:hypothetical protein